MPTLQESPHVRYLWTAADADGLEGVDRLVYRSNLLGSDPRITNTGGGNTSSKCTEVDALTGADVDVLWVKGSGGDLRTSTRANFASLYQARLMDLQRIYADMEAHGPIGCKTDAEDRMVGCYAHCTYALNPRAGSIDTPLHAFVPYCHVDHMHPNSVIAVAASKRARELTAEIFGDAIAWIPWQRPGFDLGLVMQEACRRDPNLRGIVMGQHGLINWHDDDKACYDLTLELIDRAARYIAERDQGEQAFGGPQHRSLAPERRAAILAEVLPWLRGRVARSDAERLIATIHDDDAALQFVDAVDAPRLAALGTSCPDHFLRTKIKPLYVEWDPASEDVPALEAALERGLAQYRDDYAAYYQAHRAPDSPPMRNANPSVILIPGIGMIAWGRHKSESRITAEFYRCAIAVMRGAEAIDEYVALPPQEAFDIEYWALEEAKLKRLPPERPLARRIVLVVGAGHGIGHAVAHRLAADGAHVVCADLDPEAAARTARELEAKQGAVLGAAGTGDSACGFAIDAAVDAADRDSVRAVLERTVRAYGGLDHIVVTAGIYRAPGADGGFTDAAWRQCFDVNVMGAWIVADEARRLFERQGLSGSVVLTTSVNAVVPKAGSLAYDTSKAAANHLVRELAMQMAPIVRVNAVAPATVVAGSTMFPRDRVIASLKKYGLAAEARESTEALRDRLAQFYADRTLLKAPIEPQHQAEAVRYLVGDESARTTGQILTVDGGLPEAFLR